MKSVKTTVLPQKTAPVAVRVWLGQRAANSVGVTYPSELCDRWWLESSRQASDSFLADARLSNDWIAKNSFQNSLL
ncbi:hypothetical protein Pla123a_00900 [Posidoniimonas polymericola]|uniref:Uncharacterized protein n=1 Tax=Posidoniimonas polymericola TaxID=2528002 RepID=A0A5C5ZFF0_9BACT|nr:hypothetical protein Pla123a_00900 [Posidoniimonas polymericola]